MRPHHANLLVANIDAALLTNSPGLHALSRLSIPHLDCLIRARRHEPLRVLGPAHGKDAPCVLSLSDILRRLSRLAIIQLDPPVRADGNQCVSVGTKRSAHHEPLVQPSSLAIELERRAMQETHGAIIRHGRSAQRPLLANSNRINDLAMPAHLTNTVSAVGGEAVPEPLAAVADGDDALAVAVPGDVGDAARDDGVLALGVDGLDGVPHAHLARDVARSDPEARGGELGDGRGGRVAGVLLAEGGLVDAAEEDGLAGLGVWWLET